MNTSVVVAITFLIMIICYYAEVEYGVAGGRECLMNVHTSETEKDYVENAIGSKKC